MEWITDEFGDSHAGRAQALLADGSEPRPVYLDAGSGAYMPAVTEWTIYDGRRGRPQATHIHGACSCGWRGEDRYSIAWTEEDDGTCHALEDTGPYEDWRQHITDVEAQSVTLPEPVQELLAQAEARLSDLAAESPLAALKAVAILERTTTRVGWEATLNVTADELSEAIIAKALGLSEQATHSRLLGYQLHVPTSR